MTKAFQGGRRGPSRGRGPAAAPSGAPGKPSEPIRPLDPTLTPPDITSFRHWELGEEIQVAIEAMGITVPSPIQRLAIGHVLAGKDVIAKAETGTGKTLAFGAPMMAKIDPARASVLGLVMCPTRELAEQVQKVLSELGKPRGIEVALIVGGEPLEPQIKALKRGAQVVVGTPGRILDLYKQRFLSFPWTEFAILDEADVMFEFGFIDDVKEIFSYTPEERQTLLFSATFPIELLKLARENTRDPAEVATAAGLKTVDNIEQSVIFLDDEDRTLALMRLIENSDPEDTFLVFCPRRTDVDKLIRRLERMPFSIKALHGGYDQAARFRVMAAFRTGEVKALIATDVASRGLDVKHVSTVVNYGSPHDITDYTHRIGRTGRAGRKGRAITLVGGIDRRKWTQIEREATWKIPEVDPPLRGERPRPRRDEVPVGEEQPAREERPSREARAPRAERPLREERPASAGGSVRAERPVREERPARAERPATERPRQAAPRSEAQATREETPPREARAPRSASRGPLPAEPREDRPRREERPVRAAGPSADRAPLEERPARARDQSGPPARHAADRGEPRSRPVGPRESTGGPERSWPRDEHSPARPAAARAFEPERQIEPRPDDPIDRRDRPLRQRPEPPRWPADEEAPRASAPRREDAYREEPRREALRRGAAPSRDEFREPRGQGATPSRPERGTAPAQGSFFGAEAEPEHDFRPRGPDTDRVTRRPAARAPQGEAAPQRETPRRPHSAPRPAEEAPRAREPRREAPAPSDAGRHRGTAPHRGATPDREAAPRREGTPHSEASPRGEAGPRRAAGTRAEAGPGREPASERGPARRPEPPQGRAPESSRAPAPRAESPRHGSPAPRAPSESRGPAAPRRREAGAVDPGEVRPIQSRRREPRPDY